MRRATVRDLRNRIARVLTWIEEGERVASYSPPLAHTHLQALEVRNAFAVEGLPQRDDPRTASSDVVAAGGGRSSRAMAAATLRAERCLPRGRGAVGETRGEHGVPQSRHSARRWSNRSRRPGLPDVRRAPGKTCSEGSTAGASGDHVVTSPRAADRAVARTGTEALSPRRNPGG